MHRCLVMQKRSRIFPGSLADSQISCNYHKDACISMLNKLISKQEEGLITSSLSVVLLESAMQLGGRPLSHLQIKTCTRIIQVVLSQRITLTINALTYKDIQLHISKPLMLMKLNKHTNKSYYQHLGADNTNVVLY